MQSTYICMLENEKIVFKHQNQHKTISLSEFEKLIPRRQRQKVPMTTKMALALFKQFALEKELVKYGANPQKTPLIVCNRYANWDFVSDAMSSDVGITLNNVNNYVATAWFPASIQGFLTIEYGNKAEAITLATTDKKVLLATVQSFLDKKDIQAIILGTFECFPKTIANQQILKNDSFAFGALTIIPSNTNFNSIQTILNLHQGLYQ